MKNYLISHCRTESPLFLKRLATYLEKKCLKNCKKILDIGTGFGVPAIGLKMLGKEITGIDIDPASKEFCKKYGVEVKILDIEKDILPFKNNSFDAVTSFNLIEHIKNVQNFLKEVNRILKDDGIFILVTPNYELWRDKFYESDPTHVTPYVVTSIKRAVERFNFRILEIKKKFFCPFLWRLSPLFFDFQFYPSNFFQEQSSNIFIVAKK